QGVEAIDVEARPVPHIGEVAVDVAHLDRRARGRRREDVAERFGPGERGSCPAARVARLLELLDLALPAPRQDLDDKVPDVDASARVAVLQAVALEPVDALAEVVNATAGDDDRTAVGQPFDVV